MRYPHLAWLPFVSLAALAPLVACGDRTGLLVPVVVIGDDSDAGELPEDATAITDALPPVDVTVPPDVFNDCPDAGSTFIYVVGEGGGLYSFYPPTVTFRQIGVLDCPGSAGATPFSMAVDHTGTAYVLYGDGTLYRVSTATAVCESTSFAVGQQGFDAKFGMGYSRDPNGVSETLYVIGESGNLAAIDTATFALRRVAAVNPTLTSAELTGTGGGDLFAFYSSTGNAPCADHTCVDSAIGQLDKTSGKETNQSVLKGINQGDYWAFAFWGGDFYTFTEGPNGGTRVTRYRPTDGSVVTVAQRSDFEVVGAGVSTCAPAR
jgi:hypothetical protein